MNPPGLSAVQMDWLGPPATLARAAPAQRREQGMQRAQRRAERECGETWTDQAAEYLGRYARSVALGQPFVVEDAIEVAGHHGVPLPTNARAWGPAARQASRRGLIVACGYAPTRSSNGSAKVRWRAA
jgi:hypothetical protein